MTIRNSDLGNEYRKEKLPSSIPPHIGCYDMQIQVNPEGGKSIPSRSCNAFISSGIPVIGTQHPPASIAGNREPVSFNQRTGSTFNDSS